METYDKSPLVVPFFYTATVENPQKSKEAGRPIFDEVEMVEVRLAGERNYNPHFPAHEMHVRENGEEITHAMRWPDEYARFKNEGRQVASGTPLEELTFLSAARRSELKALKIYTAEALALLDGPQLKVLAGEGYKLKEQAQAYLDKARFSSGVTAVAEENAVLKAKLDEMSRQIQALTQQGAVETAPVVSDDPYEGLTDDDLKEKLFNLTGARPRGNPARRTLIGMLNDLENDSQAA